MSLNTSTLSNNLYSLFMSMKSGMSNKQFADNFSSVINDWYKDASGATIDVGLISSGGFVGSGNVDSIDSNYQLCSSVILLTCNTIDSLKPTNAKELFAQCLAEGICAMVNTSTINCKVNGEATSGTTVTTITDAQSEGKIIIYEDETQISITDLKLPYSDYIKLSSNIVKGTVKINYSYSNEDYVATDDEEGNITSEYLNGTIDYTNGDLELEFSGDEETPLEQITISYKYQSNFKGDVLEVLNDLDVQHDESQSEWNTRLGGDADRYFANELSQIIYNQITFTMLTTVGKNEILGSFGVGKLY